MIPVNTPQISVILFKSSARTRNVTRERLSATNSLELTPFLNEGSSVTTQRSLNNPNGGFTIRLGDQYVAKYGDSIYGLVEPMDAIEIRMSRTGKPLMVMRGVVTDISLDEAMSPDGKPSRSVTITGNDYGAFLRMIQILFLKGASRDDLIIQMSGQYMQEKFGIPYGSMTAAQFVSLMIDNVVNKFIEGLSNNALQPLFVNLAGANAEDIVYPQGYQANPEGTMWSHIQRHGNLGPFYEAFFDDGEDVTTFWYRKPAFKSLQTEEYVFLDASAKSFVVPPAEITAIKYNRSERDVANFYYVRAPSADFMTGMDSITQSVMSDGQKLVTDGKGFENCDMNLFGRRAMEVNTNHGAALFPGEKKEKHEQSMNYLTAYLVKQIGYLQQSNIDNAVFESGTIRCAGRPEYKVGHYCDIAWASGVNAQAYITAVSHTFEPYRGYTSTLQYSRGTGFVNRTNAAHPYLYGQGVYA